MLSGKSGLPSQWLNTRSFSAIGGSCKDSLILSWSFRCSSIIKALDGDRAISRLDFLRFRFFESDMVFDSVKVLHGSGY